MKELAEKHLREKYDDFDKIFTDASKLEEKIGIGIFFEKMEESYAYRANDHLSITSGELIAIKKVLEILSEYPNHENKSLCICTDSLGACQALMSGDIKQCSRPDILADIFSLHNDIHNKGLSLHIVWIPSHVGITGNEIADQCANEGRVKNIVDINAKLGYSEIVSLVNREINDKVYQKNYSLNSHPTVVKFRKSFPETKCKINLDKDLYLLNRIRARADRINQFNEDIYCRTCKTKLDSKHAIKYSTLFNKQRTSVVKKLRAEKLDFKIKNIVKTELGKDTKSAIMVLLKAINEIFAI